jgi:hypothetical protein
LTFLGIDGKKNVGIPEQSSDISSWVKTIFQLYYFNSFSQNTKEFQLNEFQDIVYNEFIKRENLNELESIEENKLEEEVKNVLEDYVKYKNLMSKMFLILILEALFKNA